MSLVLKFRTSNWTMPECDTLCCN